MSKEISIIGIPLDFGQELRGVDMGPAALRYSELAPRLRQLGHTVRDTGDVKVPLRPWNIEANRPRKNYLPEITQVCQAVYEVGRKQIQKGRVPLFLGGDHSIAVGTVAAAAEDESLGLIWVDAHGDFNTPETSPSGNIHGMPLSALLGEGHPDLVNVGRPGAKIHPDNVVFIGLRDIDTQEKKRIRKSGITAFTMRDIDEQGISSVAAKAVMKFAHLKRIHLTLDMDALDPVEAPGVGTPVPGGITFREAHLLMETLADTGKISSMDLVEINPILDVANKTAMLAVDLTLSALGKSIL